MSRLQLALTQIRFTRTYMTRLLDQTKEEDWFRMTPGGVSHVAWQVGHVTMAQFRLALTRIRGSRPQDAELIGDDFLASFKRLSVPEFDAARNPSVPTIRATFDRVHDQVLRETAELSESALDEPCVTEHPLAKTKLESLFLSAHHEMIHVGQIGFLRRLLGYPVTW